MPLSEREQQILAEIEKSLYADDPTFAREVESGAPSRSDARRKLKLGALLFAGGFALLLLFFFFQIVLIGIAAFAAMVAGIVLVANGALAGREPGRTAPKERLAQQFQQWEQRLRERYKDR
ncbi:MAG: DUF3040 domain-containing protein [Actinomycetota bacterium]|nr:DUF3040 domain-containing protein [Actinomycetota bacterium]